MAPLAAQVMPRATDDDLLQPSLPGLPRVARPAGGRSEGYAGLLRRSQRARGATFAFVPPWLLVPMALLCGLPAPGWFLMSNARARGDHAGWVVARGITIGASLLLAAITGWLRVGPWAHWNLFLAYLA